MNSKRSLPSNAKQDGSRYMKKLKKDAENAAKHPWMSQTTGVDLMNIVTRISEEYDDKFADAPEEKETAPEDIFFMMSGISSKWKENDKGSSKHQEQGERNRD